MRREIAHFPLEICLHSPFQMPKNHVNYVERTFVLGRCRQSVCPPLELFRNLGSRGANKGDKRTLTDWPVTVAGRSKACTVFARSEVGIVDSNPTQDMDV
jgi:hypothetical protein